MDWQEVNVLPGAYGTDVAIVSPDLSKIGVGMATTIVIGHLVVQVLTMHVAPNVEDVSPKPGNWNKMLVQIWPIGRHNVMWPAEHLHGTVLARSTHGSLANWRESRSIPAPDRRASRLTLRASGRRPYSTTKSE
jgi:hypothetical protein